MKKDKKHLAIYAISFTVTFVVLVGIFFWFFYYPPSRDQEMSCKGPCCPTVMMVGCSIIMRQYNCSEVNPNDIILDGIHQTECKFDANKDGTIDEKDTFQTFCETYYEVPIGNQSYCRKEVCGCTG